MSSVTLPVELQIMQAVKEIFKARNVHYVRKYSNALSSKGVPTGKRSHKFYGIYFGYHAEDRSMRELTRALNVAIHQISPLYIAYEVISPITFALSYTVRPLDNRSIY